MKKRIEISLRSENNTLSDEAINQFMKQARSQPKFFGTFKKKKEVKIDDPRPPIKQRHDVDSLPSKCAHCWSEKVYSKNKEKWLCPFCEL